MSNNKLIQQGWECPKCGGVYSPYTNKCNQCPQSITFGTSTNTSTTFLCTEFIPDGFNGLNQKCMKCGKEIWQHYKITNTQ